MAEVWQEGGLYCLDKCISLDATWNKLISPSSSSSSPAKQNYKILSRMLLFRILLDRGGVCERGVELVQLMLKKISTSNINLGQKL